MAVITITKKKEIVNELIKVQFGKKIEKVVSELSSLVEKQLLDETSEDVLKTFEAHPDYFYSGDSLCLSSYYFPKQFFPNGKVISSISCYLKFSRKIPFPTKFYKGGSDEVSKWIASISNANTVSKIEEFLKLESEKASMKGRLSCLMENTAFTPKKLKNEFPEAYEVYCKLNEKNNENNSNLCDTIENIRAELNQKAKLC